MGLFTKNDITALAATKPKYEKVDTSEWKEGSFVFVRPLSAFEHNELLQKTVRTNRRTGVQTNDPMRHAHIAVAVCVNEDGTKLFTPSDAHRLAQMAVSPFVRIEKKYLEVSGLADDELENFEKNFEDPTPESES